MTFKEYMKMIKKIVLSRKRSWVAYAVADKEHIEKFLKEKYFIDHVCSGDERVLLFTKKLISDIRNRG